MPISGPSHRALPRLYPYEAWARDLPILPQLSLLGTVLRPCRAPGWRRRHCYGIVLASFAYFGHGEPAGGWAGVLKQQGFGVLAR